MAHTAYRDRLPVHAVFLDTESYQRDAEGGSWPMWHEWRLGVATYVRYRNGIETSRETQVFNRSEQLWDWIGARTNRRNPLWVFAHNLGFDLTVSGFWPRLTGGGWKLLHCVMNDPPTSLTVDTGSGAIRLVDSLNYLLMPVEEMGQCLNMPKIPMPQTVDDSSGWVERCKRDVEILAGAMSAILRTVSVTGSKTWASSAAGVSWRLYESCYANRKLLRVPDTKYREIEREAYYPGECCAYRIGNFQGNHAHVDVNSLYPWVMRHAQLPVRAESWDWTCTVDELRTRTNDGFCIARVFIDDEYRPRPVRLKGRVHRVVGRYWTTLSGAELRSALDYGVVRSVREWIHYTTDNFLCGFVLDLYERRLDARESGNLMESAWYKILMNGLTGKFVQRNGQWVDCPDEIPLTHYGQWTHYDYEKQEFSAKRAIAGLVQTRTERTDWEHARPAVGAAITAAGRERMRQLREHAGPDDVHYQDTDSLILTDSAWGRLRDRGEHSETRLGALRLQGVYDSCRVWGRKRYALGGRVVAAGVDRGQRVSADCVYSRTDWQSLQSILSCGDIGVVGFRERKVVLGDLSLAGCVGEDGRVLPLTIHEDCG